MTTKTKPKTLTTNEKLITLFEQYLETVGAILDDYVVGNDGMFTELAEADKSFKGEIEDFEFEPSLEKAITVIKDNADDMDTGDLLDVLDDSIIIDHVTSLGYSCIKTENIVDQQKLEDFVQQNIYPYSLNPYLNEVV